MTSSITPDLSGLCERLREHERRYRRSALLASNRARRDPNQKSQVGLFTRRADDLSEAAAAIERLVAENERMREALTKIAGIEPKPFEGGLDMEAIRACDECKRYEGHPIQHGICNTHRRPIWDREKHESHEEKALGYRAKTIARTALKGASDDR